MNNKHQELIAEKVEDLISQGFCFQHEIITETGSYPKTKEALNKTLQDTIDTVLEEERKRVNNNIELLACKVDERRMGAHGREIIKLKTLDKTPPNKV